MKNKVEKYTINLHFLRRNTFYMNLINSNNYSTLLGVRNIFSSNYRKLHTIISNFNCSLQNKLIISDQSRVI